MNGLREKFRNKKGFTLIEMLIVVAIIAILIAISIPVVGSALESARKATDAANVRAAVAEAKIQYLTDEGKEGQAIAATTYDAKAGKLTGTGDTAPTAYGKSDALKTMVVWVAVSADGEVTWNWAVPGTAPTAWNTGSPMTTDEGVKIAT